MQENILGLLLRLSLKTRCSLLESRKVCSSPLELRTTRASFPSPHDGIRTNTLQRSIEPSMRVRSDPVDEERMPKGLGSRRSSYDVWGRFRSLRQMSLFGERDRSALEAQDVGVQTSQRQSSSRVDSGSVIIVPSFLLMIRGMPKKVIVVESFFTQL